MLNQLSPEVPYVSRKALKTGLRPRVAQHLAGVLMAGGYGTRLGPLTRNIPKPMVPLAGKPVIERIVDHLVQEGIHDVVVALHYLPQVIRDHFKDTSSWSKLDLQFYEAQEDLGTAGSVRAACELVQAPRVLVHSGDLLTNFDLGMLHRFHRRMGSVFTIALCHVDDARPYGVAHLDENHQIKHFAEKPKVNPPGGAWINAGIYIMEREIIERVPLGQFTDFSRNLIPQLMAEGVPVHGCQLPGYWFDMGTPATLAEAEAFLRSQRQRERDFNILRSSIVL